MASAPGLAIFSRFIKLLPKPDTSIKNIRTVTECDDNGNVKKHKVCISYLKDNETFEGSFFITK